MHDLRAGLIGLGMMGRHHARVLRSLEGVELVAVADPGGDPYGVAGVSPSCQMSKRSLQPALTTAWSRHQPPCTTRSGWPSWPPISMP